MGYGLGSWSPAGQVLEYIISRERRTTAGQAVPSAHIAVKDVDSGKLSALLWVTLEHWRICAQAHL